ncbi:MAG TPA: shikimate dehydrogenase [Deltaproteobacteria bacterium]|nr:shikimate dehydrogenase [Deltaproteobacteria bacterium]
MGKVRITNRTRLAGIFGDPVEQSLSPVMHNAAFEATGIDMVYLPFRVAPGSLVNAVTAVRGLEMPGVNITIPHKERVMGLLDEVSDEARAIGAVNTVVNDGGRLRGHNTDGRGWLASLVEETGFDPRGKTCLVAGAGGSARAVLHTLLREGIGSVTVANRTLERAEALIDDLSELFPDARMTAMVLSKGLLVENAREADLVVNTTSLGMMGRGAPDLPVEAMRPGAVASDIVYRPLDTDFLKAAARRGLRVHRGLGMLLYQGALAFELWTGRKAPVETMRAALEGALKEPRK